MKKLSEESARLLNNFSRHGLFGLNKEKFEDYKIKAQAQLTEEDIDIVLTKKPNLKSYSDNEKIITNRIMAVVSGKCSYDHLKTIISEISDDSTESNLLESLVYLQDNCPKESLQKAISGYRSVNDSSFLQIFAIIKNKNADNAILEKAFYFKNQLTYSDEHREIVIAHPNFNIKIISDTDEKGYYTLALQRNDLTPAQFNKFCKEGNFDDGEDMEKLKKLPNYHLIKKEVLNQLNESGMRFIIGEPDVSNEEIETVLNILDGKRIDDYRSVWERMFYNKKVPSKIYFDKLLAAVDHKKSIQRVALSVLNTFVNQKNSLTIKQYKQLDKYISNDFYSCLLHDTHKTPTSMLWKIEMQIDLSNNSYDRDRLKKHKNYKKTASHVLKELKSL